jgi:hypothetical protein
MREEVNNFVNRCKVF